MSNLAGTYLAQAEEHLSAGNTKKAIDLLEHAAALGPSGAEAGRIYWNLAEAYRRIGQSAKENQYRKRAEAAGFLPITQPVKPPDSQARKRTMIFSWKSTAIGAAGLVIVMVLSLLIYRVLTSSPGTNDPDKPTAPARGTQPADRTPGHTDMSQPISQVDLPSLVREITPSTVFIITYDKQDKLLAVGSGFFVSPNGEVITNRHVLEGAHRAEVKTNQGSIYPVSMVLAEDESGDLIRVSTRIPSQPVNFLQMSRTVPEIGEKVIVIGNPLGLEATVSDGIVSAVREIPALGNILQLTAPISAGSSGSPVVNMSGEVIGVAIAQAIEGQNLNFAIPAERVLNLNTRNSRTFADWEKTVRERWQAEAEQLFRKGVVLVWMEDCERALSCFEEVIQKRADHAEAHFFIGICHLDQGDYSKAIKAYKQAIQVRPDYDGAYYALGLTYLLVGDKTSALEQYMILKSMDPELSRDLYNHIYE